MTINAIIPANNLQVKRFITNQFEPAIHKKRLESLSDAVLGVLTSQSLVPSHIGEGLAQAKGLLPKHAKKQVDRLLSNQALPIPYCESVLTALLISNRTRISVAMDWTVFAKDAQMTLTCRLVTTHGRATPLLSRTVSTVGLKGQKTRHVFELLAELKKYVPANCQVICLADREFGTLNNMKYVKEQLGFDYIFRIRRNFTITSRSGINRLAYEWLNLEEATCIDNAKITVQEYAVKKVVVCRDKGMKEMWCLASSLSNIATQTILNYYNKRWSTETSYRDEKDLQFGFGLKKARIKNIHRRRCLLLISAIAIIFLTLLGAVSEAIGFDKYLKSNTARKRTHSLFAQGRLLLRLLPSIKDPWKQRIVQNFLRLYNSIGNNINEQYVL